MTLTAVEVEQQVNALIERNVHIIHLHCTNRVAVEIGHRSTRWWLKVRTGGGALEADGAKIEVRTIRNDYPETRQVCHIAVGYKGSNGLSEHGTLKLEDGDVERVEAIE